MVAALAQPGLTQTSGRKLDLFPELWVNQFKKGTRYV
jgi:hypothetical protein